MFTRQIALAALTAFLGCTFSGRSGISEVSAKALRQETGDEPFLLWSTGEVVPLGPGARKALLHAPDSAMRVAGGLTWAVTYTDVVTRSGKGFDDPEQGLERRKALEDTLLYVDKVLGANHRAVIAVTVEASLHESSNILASAASVHPASTSPGIVAGHTATHIQTGIDPDPTLPDLVVRFNFFHRFHPGPTPPPVGTTDMRSVALHEVTHALGMASLIGPDGTSRRTGTNPGVYTTFDTLSVRPGGGALVDKTGRFVATPQDLSGGSANEAGWAGPLAQASLGRLPRLHSPSPFENGSSLSHWSLQGPVTVMQPAIAQAVRRRNYLPVEEQMLRDLGYVNAQTPTSRLLAFHPGTRLATDMFVQALATQELDDTPGEDLVVLGTVQGRNVLRVYSGHSSSTAYDYPVSPNLSYMSVGTVGPQGRRGLLLASNSQESLLALGGLKLPLDRTHLRDDDFSHRHFVHGPQSNSQTLPHDPGVASGDINGDGLTDWVTSSPRYGLLAFESDPFHYFDRLKSPQTVLALGPQVNVGLDLATYQTGGPPPGIDVPFWQSVQGRDIATRDPPTGALMFRARQGPDAYRIERLARYGVIGFAGLRNLSTDDYDLARLRVDANGNYRFEQRWTEIRAVSDIAISGLREEAFVATGTAHTIERVSLTTSSLGRLAGSTAGYQDGPLASALFNTPTALCIKGQIIYVIDSGNALIRRIDLDKREVSTVAGRAGVRVYTDGPFGTGSFAFAARSDNCAIIGDSLYVLDGFGTWDTNQLRKVNLNNGHVSTVPQDGLGRFEAPGGLSALDLKLFVLQGNFNQLTVNSVESSPTAGTMAKSTMLRLADIDHDGADDLVALLTPGLRAMNCYHSNRDGGFRFLKQVVFDQPPGSVELRDVDRDGHVDAVVTFAASLRVLRGDGTCNFTEEMSRRVGLSGHVTWSALHDIDANGRPDLALIDDTGQFLVMLADDFGRWGNGPGDMGEDYRVRLDLPNASWFTLADVNADGRPDILVRTGDGRGVTVRLGRAP
ncbi:FG-GAP-like repeat-containing protein [Corallococcus exercitus]|uniref:FG-GAP-like repeat-containing protein n=1 Tax=Corallococcus exercitus TaxID=2316736 RepID=UPI0035D3FBBD